MLLSTLTLLSVQGGCAHKQEPNLIQGDDFQFLAKDEVYTAKKDGAFLSDFYLEKIAGIELADGK